jgi:hypothetical protein
MKTCFNVSGKKTDEVSDLILHSESQVNIPAKCSGPYESVTWNLAAAA